MSLQSRFYFGESCFINVFATVFSILTQWADSSDVNCTGHDLCLRYSTCHTRLHQWQLLIACLNEQITKCMSQGFIKQWIQQDVPPEEFRKQQTNDIIVTQSGKTLIVKKEINIQNSHKIFDVIGWTFKLGRGHSSFHFKQSVHWLQQCTTHQKEYVPIVYR